MEKQAFICPQCKSKEAVKKESLQPEQRTSLARGLKKLIEKLSIETEYLTIAYVEDRPYFSDEFFCEFLGE